MNNKGGRNEPVPLGDMDIHPPTVRQAFNGTIVSAAICAAFELGILEQLETKGALSLHNFANERRLDPAPIRVVVSALRHAGILKPAQANDDHLVPGVHFKDAWLNKGYFLWLVRGYGEMLTQVARLCESHPSQSTAQYRRDGSFIARAGREYGHHFVDPVFYRVIEQINFSAAADLGCGSGDRLLRLARMYPKCHFVGIELDPAALKIARLGVREAGLSTRIDIIHGDVRTLSEASFPGIDLVFSFFLGHEFWPLASCITILGGLRSAFPDVRDFLLADTFRHGFIEAPNTPIFPLAFELTHALMKQYIPSEAEWRNAFEESPWQLLATHDLLIPASAIFRLTPRP